MSELERQKELVRQETSDDPPLGGPDRTNQWRIWFLIVAGLVAALAIPITFVAMGLASAMVTSGWAWALALGSAIVFFSFVGLVLYVYSRLVPRHSAKGLGEPIDVGSLMRTPVVLCGYLDSIAECARYMYRHNVGFLAVLDSQDRCIGVVTDRDFVCGGIAQGLDLDTTPVTAVLESGFRSVRPDQPVEDCLAIMRDEGVRRLPVVEHGRLVGVISVDDLIAEGNCSVEEIAPIFARQLSQPRGRAQESEAA